MEPAKRAKILDRLIFFVLGVVVTLVVQAFVLPAAYAQTIDATSISGSNANASSGSISGSSSASNQSATLGAQQGNAQNITFNTQQLRETKAEVRTNTAVPLAAAVSYSSDYCGGVGSVGASSGVLGVSLGGAKPIMDGNCQSMRRAEKFGVMAVTARNMGNHTLAARLLAMSVWELCTSEANAGRREGAMPSTQAGCLRLGLVVAGAMPDEPALPDNALPESPPVPEPKDAQKAKAESEQGADVASSVPHTDALAQHANASMAWRPPTP